MSDEIEKYRIPEQELAERAKKYFEDAGIDPSEAPTQAKINVNETDNPPGSHQCIINTYSYLFYTYCTVKLPSLGWQFTGHAGGLGVGAVTAVGYITYSNLDKLVATGDFGLTTVSAVGGGVFVTWGSHGNAFGAAVGRLAAAAMGGHGSWSRI